MRAEGLNADVSVVVPVYRNTETLRGLRDRLAAALAGRIARFEIIFVDDGCPSGSGAILDQLASEDPRVRVLTFNENRGQQRAIMSGLGAASGATVVVMDADLQDPPEAVQVLLDALDADPEIDVVFAGRRGRYQSASRMLSSRLTKWLIAALVGVPRDAGAFSAMRLRTARRVGSMGVRSPHLVVMIGASGARTISIPVTRSIRPAGRSAYSTTRRMSAGLSALGLALRLRLRSRPTVEGGSDAEITAHNLAQRRHYARGPTRRLEPVETSYVRRHVDEVLAFVGASPGERILEAGSGAGRHAHLLRARGFDVTGLELSPSLIAAMQAPGSAHETQIPHDTAVSLGAVPTHCGDLMDPPKELHCAFDLVLGFFVLHHVADLCRAFEGAAKLLRPGGRAAFVEPNPLNPTFYIQIALTPGMSWRVERGILALGSSNVCRAAEAAGLHPLPVRRFGFMPPALANHAAGSRIEQWLEKQRVLAPVRAFQVVGGSLP